VRPNCYIEETEDGGFIPVLALGFAPEDPEDDVIVVVAMAKPMSTYDEAEAFIDANAPDNEDDDFT
jgi:hypothetical protein